MKRHKKQILLAAVFIFLSFLTSGCSSRTELEDKDFVMALGIEIVGEQYRFTYQMPNFGATTGQNEKERNQGTVVLSGNSMAEIENKFMQQSEKKLDYNHMKAVILHEDLAEKERQIKEVLFQFQEKYECGRNTYIYFSDVSPKILLEEGKKEEDIGSYLEKLRQNKDMGRIKRQVTIGNYITCSNNDTEFLIVPFLSLKEGSVQQMGAGIAEGARLRKKITEEEYQMIDFIFGKGSGWQLTVDPDHLLTINHLMVSDWFREENGSPVYTLTVAGKADIRMGEDWDMEEYNQRLAQGILRQINSYSKEEGLDYLNLYRKCGIKNRKLWMQYKGKERRYLDKIKVEVICSLK